MPTFSGADLVAAAASCVALFGSMVLLAMLSRARAEVLGDRRGWQLVAFALALFALRGLSHFWSSGWAEHVGHTAGIVAGLLLPLGLYVIFRTAPTYEVSRPAR